MSGISVAINLVSALLLTTMTGSLALVIWYFAGRVLVRFGYLRWYYVGLKVVICMFLLPMSYLILIWINGYNSVWQGKLFVRTVMIVDICQVVCIIWATGIVLVGAKYLFEAYCLARRNRNIIPCTGLEYRIFTEICRTQRIPEGKVRLFWSHHVMTVEFMGVFHPKVIIPEKIYSENDSEMLKAVFLHELVHYKQGDIFWKRMIMLIMVLQYFNPMVWWLNRLMGKWSEYACDVRVCDLTKRPAVYFSNILQMAQNICKGRQYHTTIQLAKDENDLVERVKYMDELRKYTKKPICMAVLTSLLLMTICTVSVSAASNEVAKRYVDWYEMTDVKETVDLEPPVNYIEYTDNGADSSTTVSVGEVNDLSRSIKYFNWTVPVTGLRVTRNFHVNKGEIINVNVFQKTQTDKNILVGLILPSSTRIYVKGNTHVANNFTAETTGYYQVFVENPNHVAIDVEGTFNVY
ncbi:MAG: M56 family metallopeptidase [Lachnospiraceae bacterium]|nr:M56 family metallopeptidase [Lachnospiraceae bacterium]